MVYVTAQRQLLVRTGTPADVLSRIRDGLVRRGRRIDSDAEEGIRFRGGWGLAWRTAQRVSAMSRRVLAGIIVLALLIYAPAASATFPGRDGIIALPVNHIPYVIGIARVGASGRAVSLESRKTSFYFGCQINTSL